MLDCWPEINEECSNLRISLVLIYQWIIFCVFLLLIFAPLLLLFQFSGLVTTFEIIYVILLVVVLLWLAKKLNDCPSIIKGIALKNTLPPKGIDYHLILIAHTGSKDSNGSYSSTDYLDGMDILSNFFLNSCPQIPFVVRDISTGEEFIRSISDPKAQYLWIFGHGQRNLIRLNDGPLCYKKTIQKISPPLSKKFVGQYHCNSPFGTSLAELTHSKESDVTSFIRFPLFTRWAIKRKIKELQSKGHFN
jgi:hypothetical protein